MIPVAFNKNYEIVRPPDKRNNNDITVNYKMILHIILYCFSLRSQLRGDF